MVSCLYCVHPEKWFFTTLLEYRRSNLCRIFLSLAFLFSAFGFFWLGTCSERSELCCAKTGGAVYLASFIHVNRINGEAGTAEFF